MFYGRTSTFNEARPLWHEVGQSKYLLYLLNTLNFILNRYRLYLIGLNGLGSESELAVDDVSLSPQCFGLGVPEDILDGWRYNMTDVEFCHYFGKKYESRILLHKTMFDWLFTSITGRSHCVEVQKPGETTMVFLVLLERTRAQLNT